MILVKVYGAFYPAGTDCLAAVREAGRDAVGHEEPWLFGEDGMVRISFEGVYFPLDETLAALERTLPDNAEGRLDYLDLEAWTLTRHVLAPGRAIDVATRSLNHVLDYAGH